MKTEEEVWAYILGYVADNGYVPSLSQIAEEFGWSNKMSAKSRVDKLIKAGYLKKVKKPQHIYYELIN
jgi:DNA-binding transcriptional regulator PaaX